MKKIISLIIGFSTIFILPSIQAVFAESEQVPVDKFGIVEKITAKPTAHWLWVSDTNFISFSDGRAHLIDGDTGHYFGSLNTGYVHAKLVLPSHYREIYSAETYYSRHVGGTRTDMVRIYDPVNLSLLDEIMIPNKRATTIPRTTSNALSENDRFMAVFNLTPATSASIVDLKERKFVGEIELPGCAQTIPAGGLRFLSLCSDGAALSFELDEHGKLAIDEAVAAGNRDLKVGDKISLVPGHVDPTVNFYDWYVCIRGGRVEALWPITATGVALARSSASTSGRPSSGGTRASWNPDAVISAMVTGSPARTSAVTRLRSVVRNAPMSSTDCRASRHRWKSGTEALRSALGCILRSGTRVPRSGPCVLRSAASALTCVLRPGSCVLRSAAFAFSCVLRSGSCVLG